MAEKVLKKVLESHPVEASAACRIDCGGTLDIKTFHYPLRHLSPCTFNIALNMKTRVRLFPYSSNLIKVSSRGFQTEEHPADSAPFNSPLGLMFAVAAYFGAEGVHIEIVSESPPRSALGGSSTAAVALIAALSTALGEDNGLGGGREKIVLLAHAIEEAVAGVPCGLQDQLAAAYGGVHAWYWPSRPTEPPFEGIEVLTERNYGELESRLLVAYCGIPHESRNINSKWVNQFVAGKARSLWAEIATSTNAFVRAVGAKDWPAAVHAVSKEVEIRRKMTPEVFDEMGTALLESALAQGCGARFTGSGGGGCIWSLGEKENIGKLRPVWHDILSQRDGAGLLEVKVHPIGLEIAGVAKGHI
ncbi:MAG: galactokinase [Desulfobacterales bacterium]|nr:galactokinase [Desulfobacterales bacterium]